MPIFLEVMLGSALGGLLRYLCTLYLPLPILIVNIIGSFVIGFTSVRLGTHYPQYLPLINTGVLGGLTTFSTFSLEALEYMLAGKFLIAIGYVMISVVVSLGACFLGYKLG